MNKEKPEYFTMQKLDVDESNMLKISVSSVCLYETETQEKIHHSEFQE